MDQPDANDVLMFDSRDEAEAFVAARNHAIIVGEAFGTPGEAANYMTYLLEVASQWGFHRMTPVRRGVITEEAPMTISMTLPQSTIDQHTIERSFV